MRILADTTYAPLSVATVPTPPAVSTASQQSPCRSPVPYLFGGLAAMLGLVGFALLILACSHRRLSGSSSSAQVDEENGDEARTVDGEGYSKAVKGYEEKIVVIMAGDEKPTFLATPVCSRGRSFGDSLGKSKGDGESSDAKKDKDENMDNTKGVNNVNNDDVGSHVVHGHKTHNSAADEENRGEAAEDQTQLQN